jgi:uncharacterized membrane protein
MGLPMRISSVLADESVRADSRRLKSFAGAALKSSAALWFSVAVIGQAVFVLYILAFYGGSALKGNLEDWGKVLPHGIIPGDALGNAALAIHLLLAAIITVGGPLQLLPQVRARAPSFHRWNGRVYLLMAVTASITGLYMVWFRGGVDGMAQHLGVSLNALLILLGVAMALRFALARNFSAHRRWALRLFLLVSGVWFFRVGLFLWLIIHQGPAGFDPKTFEGPFLSFLSFAQYLVPLAVLELYFHTQDHGSASGHIAMAGSLLVLTAAMAVGIFGATMGLWLPRI